MKFNQICILYIRRFFDAGPDIFEPPIEKFRKFFFRIRKIFLLYFFLTCFFCFLQFLFGLGIGFCVDRTVYCFAVFCSVCNVSAFPVSVFPSVNIFSFSCHVPFLSLLRCFRSYSSPVSIGLLSLRTDLVSFPPLPFSCAVSALYSSSRCLISVTELL